MFLNAPDKDDVLKARLFDLSGLHLAAECKCGRSADMAMKLAGAGKWSNATLGEFVGRLVCATCGERPSGVWLCENWFRKPCGGPVPGWSVLLAGGERPEGHRAPSRP